MRSEKVKSNADHWSRVFIACMQIMKKSEDLGEPSPEQRGSGQPLAKLTSCTQGRREDVRLNIKVLYIS